MKQMIARGIINGYVGFINLATQIFNTTESSGGEADKIIQQMFKPVYVILAVFVGGVELVGAFLVLKAGAALFQSIQDRDSTGTYQAGLSLIAAFMLMGIGALVGVFGIKLA